MKQLSDESTVLHAEGVSSSYGSREVLSGVTLEWRRGETLGLLGSNGAGKTTLIRLIAGLQRADRGTLISIIEPDHRNLGVAPQEIALYPALSAEENLVFFGRIGGLRGGGLPQRVEEVISELELTPYRSSRLDSLSGGWQRRLNLAAAVVHRPQVLLLDEPTAGLDVEARLLVWRYLRKLREEGTSVLVTTHQLEEVEEVCDRVAILAKGRLIAVGSPAELCSLVPAAEIATVESSQPDALERRARELGLPLRCYGGRSALLLRERTTVSALAEELGDVSLRSLTLAPVSLMHAYVELCGTTGGTAGQPGVPM